MMVLHNGTSYTLHNVYEDIEVLAYALADMGFRVKGQVDGGAESRGAYDVSQITEVGNSCGDPLMAGLLESYRKDSHYFLWMDNPRSLSIPEISSITQVPEIMLNYLFKIPPPEKAVTGV